MVEEVDPPKDGAVVVVAAEAMEEVDGPQEEEVEAMEEVEEAMEEVVVSKHSTMPKSIGKLYVIFHLTGGYGGGGHGGGGGGGNY